MDEDDSFYDRGLFSNLNASTAHTHAAPLPRRVLVGPHTGTLSSTRTLPSDLAPDFPHRVCFLATTQEPIEIVTLNIGPETGLGSGTHDTEFFISDFDVLVPTNATH